jgi:hypothetical protein
LELQFPTFFLHFPHQPDVDFAAAPFIKKGAITMTVTKKQIAANRQNAQKSTGPTSPEGKAKASKNALKYGFNAKDMILNTPVFNENPAEYEALLDSLYEELKPATALQEYLVRKIANSLWRSRRIPLAETA